MGTEQVFRTFSVLRSDSSLSNVKAQNSAHTLQSYHLCALNVISANQKFVLFDGSVRFSTENGDSKILCFLEKKSTRIHDVTSHDTAIFIIATM